MLAKSLKYTKMKISLLRNTECGMVLVTDCENGVYNFVYSRMRKYCL